jgi:hypothetical protein
VIFEVLHIEMTEDLIHQLNESASTVR